MSPLLLNPDEPDEWVWNENLQPVALPEPFYTPENGSLLSFAGWGPVNTQKSLKTELMEYF